MIHETKPGVSLPAVTGLTAAPADSNRVLLTWQVPGDISDNIVQPLSVFVEVRAPVSNRVVSIFTVTLPDGPTEYLYQLPDSSATQYQLTVKLNGMTKSNDVNFSNTIYSPGETVTYQRK